MSELGKTIELPRKGQRVRVNERGPEKRWCYLNGADAGFPAASLERAFSSLQFFELGESAVLVKGIDCYGGVKRKD